MPHVVYRSQNGNNCGFPIILTIVPLTICAKADLYPASFRASLRGEETLSLAHQWPNLVLHEGKKQSQSTRIQKTQLCQ